MARDFCLFLASRFSEQKCSYQNEAKIITFSVRCRHTSRWNTKLQRFFEIENLRSETNCKTNGGESEHILAWTSY